MSADTPENSELSESDVRAIIRDELNNHNEDGDEISRRDFGKAGVLAALGLGGAAGVGGRQAVENAVEPAKASHGGGTIGEEGDPVGSIYAHQFGSSTEPIQTLHADSQTDFTVGTLNADEILSTFYTSIRGSDGTAIQSALDDAAATSSWARVVVDPIGSDAPYLVDSSAPLEVSSKTVVEIREDVKLAGGTQENIFQNKNFEDDTTDDSDIWFVGDGGSLDGNKANQTENDGTNKNRASGFYQNGVSILGAQRVWIRSLESNNNQYHGVNVSAVTGALVEGSHFEGNYYSGIHSHWRESDSNPNYNVRSIGNTVTNGGGAQGQSAAIFYSGTSDGVISDNTVRDQTSTGIVVFNGGGGLATNNNTVTGNVVKDVAGGSSVGKAAGIRVITSSSTGSGVSDVTIASNIVDNSDATANGQRGIYVNTRETSITDISITGNSVVTHGNAIEIDGGGAGTLQDFSVSGNFAQAISYNFGRGILVKDARDATVDGNICAKNQGSGLFIWGDTKTTTQVSVSDNILRDNGQAGNTTYGIRLVGSVDSCPVTGNKAYDTGGGTQTHGIYEDTTPSNNGYLLNDLRGNATGGHSLNGTSPITDAVGQGTAEDWNLT